MHINIHIFMSMPLFFDISCSSGWNDFLVLLPQAQHQGHRWWCRDHSWKTNERLVRLQPRQPGGMLESLSINRRSPSLLQSASCPFLLCLALPLPSSSDFFLSPIYLFIYIYKILSIFLSVCGDCLHCLTYRYLLSVQLAYHRNNRQYIPVTFNSSPR